MDWLKKKKDEAKQAANVAKAKIQNRNAGGFKGQGRVLGGNDDSADSEYATASIPTKSSTSKFSFTKPKETPLSEEEQNQRREARLRAIENRGNAWEKRVIDKRHKRLLQEKEYEDQFAHLPAPPPTNSTQTNVPPPIVLTNDEVKLREIQRAQNEMGFNPYAATFSSSAQNTAAMNAITSNSTQSYENTSSEFNVEKIIDCRDGPNGPELRVRWSGWGPEGDTWEPRTTMEADVPDIVKEFDEMNSSGKEFESSSSTAVYTLLQQPPAPALVAAQTIMKLLRNIISNPNDDKYRRIRLSNAAIQNKIVSVNGALTLLKDVGFQEIDLEGEAHLYMSQDVFSLDQLTTAIDSLDVAITQLQHDLQ